MKEKSSQEIDLPHYSHDTFDKVHDSKNPKEIHSIGEQASSSRGENNIEMNVLNPGINDCDNICQREINISDTSHAGKGWAGLLFIANFIGISVFMMEFNLIVDDNPQRFIYYGILFSLLFSAILFCFTRW